MTLIELENFVLALNKRVKRIDREVCCLDQGESGTFWGLGGNGGSNITTNFIGTTDEQGFVIKTNNEVSGSLGWFNDLKYNTSFGNQSLPLSSTGVGNSGFGFRSLYANTSGNYNTGVGWNTLMSNTTGSTNVAIGAETLASNTTGSNNMALGADALTNNVSGSRNTALGRDAALNSVSGNDITCVGYQAVGTPGTASNLIALGSGAVASANEFAISSFITQLKFALNTHTGGAIMYSSAASALNSGTGIGKWNIPSINSTAGDSATIDAISGRFRKDASGAVFTLNNNFILATSIIILTAANAAIDATATTWTVSAGVGSATVTFNAAPTANFDMNFFVIN